MRDKPRINTCLTEWNKQVQKGARAGGGDREWEEGGDGDEKRYFLRSWPSKTFMSNVYVECTWEWRGREGSLQLGSLKLDSPSVCQCLCWEDVCVKKFFFFLIWDDTQARPVQMLNHRCPARIEPTTDRWRITNRDQTETPTSHNSETQTERGTRKDVTPFENIQKME